MNNGRKMFKRNDFTLADMKQFFGMIIIMGQVKEDTGEDHWF